MIVDAAGEYLEQSVPKYGLILKNGMILKSSIDEKAILKVFPIVLKILPDLPPQHMFYKPPIVIYRLTENVLVILLTQTAESIIERLLEGFSQQFIQSFTENYSILPKSIADLMKFSIFSAARQAGPEPIAWMFDSETLKEEQLFKYSLSSMMVLMNEVNGANKRILNFHPFISEENLGLIFLFQIPLDKARGNAFDAALLVMTAYDNRAVFYQHHLAIENIFSITSDEISSLFIQTFAENPHQPLDAILRGRFQEILDNLHQRMRSVNISLEKKRSIVEDMKDTINQLSKFL